MLDEGVVARSDCAVMGTDCRAEDADWSQGLLNPLAVNAARPSGEST
ncbi:MAG: hypothetical protein QOI54_2002 [Actinomycetota bacterium]|jgi:hypothetical protein|nr:hypothetical protein [Actinomycetota bacterium]